jgi:hypothetical protein
VTVTVTEAAVVGVNPGIVAVTVVCPAVSGSNAIPPVLTLPDESELPA